MRKIKLIALLLALSMFFMLMVACNKENGEGSIGDRLSEGMRNGYREGGSEGEEGDLTSAIPNDIIADPNQPQDDALPENTFTALMPALRIPLKEVIDNEFGTTAVYNTVSDKDFEAIVNAAQKKGFTENIEQAELTFTATNKDGMFIKIAVDSEALRISVYADEKHFE
ncbi:MAG TPA: hypothetical protein GXZ61_02080 [Clostridiales bacterium]|jgi:hypothetical protein|nr:hypothetical protein [Clostridiales bacterium]